VALNLSPGDSALLTEILPELLHMGYKLEPFGMHSFLLQGSPGDHPSDNDQSVIEMVLENIKDGASGLHKSYRERIAKTLAKKHAVKTGVKLNNDEMRVIVEQLADLSQPNIHFEGKPTFIEVKKDHLSTVFGY
jgi:DNA mismatch repair protein MutL